MSINDVSRQARRNQIDTAILDEFRRAEFAALFVAGTTTLVPRAFGDNMGGWPIKLGLTRSMQDTVSPNLDGASPFWEQRMLFRCWVEGWERARMLEKSVREAIALANTDPLRKSWTDMGHRFDPAFFELEVNQIALTLGIDTHDDDSMMTELARRVHKRMMAKSRDGLRRR